MSDHGSVQHELCFIATTIFGNNKQYNENTLSMNKKRWTKLLGNNVIAAFGTRNSLWEDKDTLPLLFKPRMHW